MNKWPKFNQHTSRFPQTTISLTLIIKTIPWMKKLRIWRERAEIDFGRAEIWREAFPNLKRKSQNHFQSEEELRKYEDWDEDAKSEEAEWNWENDLSKEGERAVRIWNKFCTDCREHTMESFNTVAGYEKNLSVRAVWNPSQCFTRFWDRFVFLRKFVGKNPVWTCHKIFTRFWDEFGTKISLR